MVWDLVVIKHWSHAWIKEGMASYSEVMWTEQEYGAEDAAYYRLLEARNYLRDSSTAALLPTSTGKQLNRMTALPKKGLVST